MANAAPIGALEDIARRASQSDRITALTTLLLGLAGFSDRGPPESLGIARAKLGTPLNGDQWKLFRVRPSNHPRRRVEGAAILVARFADEGLLAGMARVADAGSPSKLTESLSVGSGIRGGTALVGNGRARDIAVNAVLPFLHGWSTLAGHAGRPGAILELYRNYGKLTENEITRELASALQPAEWGRVARTARQQQGLIHLQRLLAGAGGRIR